MLTIGRRKLDMKSVTNNMENCIAPAIDHSHLTQTLYNNDNNTTRNITDIPDQLNLDLDLPTRINTPPTTANISFPDLNKTNDGVGHYDIMVNGSEDPEHVDNFDEIMDPIFDDLHNEVPLQSIAMEDLEDLHAEVLDDIDLSGALSPSFSSLSPSPPSPPNPTLLSSSSSIALSMLSSSNTSRAHEDTNMDMTSMDTDTVMDDHNHSSEDDDNSGERDVNIKSEMVDEPEKPCFTNNNNINNINTTNNISNKKPGVSSTSVTPTPRPIPLSSSDHNNQKQRHQHEFPGVLPGDITDDLDLSIFRLFPIPVLRKERSEFNKWKKANRIRKLDPRETKRLAKIRRTMLARVYADRARQRREKTHKEAQTECERLRAELKCMKIKVAKYEKMLALR